MAESYMKGLLSIVVPIFNAQKYLRDMIDSLLGQTYSNKEIILIDDGSIDDSASICDEYATKYECIRVIHKKNEGVVATRNRGLAEAFGEYITLPDNDDVIDCQAYETLINAMEQTDCDVAACAVKKEYSKKIYPVVKHERIPEPYIYEGAADALEGIGAKSNDLCGFLFNKVFKRDVIGNLNFRQVSICDDMWFCYEVLAKAKRAAYIDLPFYHYRYVAGSGSKNGGVLKYMNCLQALEDLIQWCLSNAPQCTASVVRDYLFWNTKACESMLKRPDKEAFVQIQKNVSSYKKYISGCSFRIRLLCKAIMISWYAYMPLGMLVWYLKKAYIVLHRIR